MDYMKKQQEKCMYWIIEVLNGLYEETTHHILLFDQKSNQSRIKDRSEKWVRLCNIWNVYDGIIYGSVGTWRKKII